jgi:hypothetical protein
MGKIQITKYQAISLHDEETVEGFELIETGEWEDDGKYQYQSIIFKKDGKFYCNSIQRSGSYFTDYDYEYFTDCNEVQKVEVTTKIWVNV